MTTATATETTKATKSNKPADIREGLPIAVKGGTKSSPVWTIDGKDYEFIKPTDRTGRIDGKKVPLGSTGVLAKYDAGKTAAGNVLYFVGLFRPKK